MIFDYVGRRAAGWIATLGLLGCGPSTGGDGTGASGSGTAADSDGTSTGQDDATGTPTPTPPGTTGPEPTTTGVEPTTEDVSTGSDLCPDPEAITADFTVEPPVDIESNCTVTAIGGDPGLTLIDLDCEGQPVQVTVTADPPQWTPHASVGQAVHLTYITDPIFWINRWLALRTADGESDSLLVGGVSGSALDPPGTTLDALFSGAGGGPTVTEISGVCELVLDDCGQSERLALDFAIPEGGPVRVLDGSIDLIDVLAYGYGFMVSTAVRYAKPVLCDDLPEAWFQLLVLYFPSE